MKKFEVTTQPSGYGDGTRKVEQRIIVDGIRHFAGFGAGFVPAGVFERKVTGGPKVEGPWAFCYGHATVITSDRRGTSWEIEQEEAAGKVIRAALGDVLVIDGIEFVIGPDHNDNMKLTQATK